LRVRPEPTQVKHLFQVLHSRIDIYHWAMDSILQAQEPIL
jgi:hypothetical protein